MAPFPEGPSLKDEPKQPTQRTFIPSSHVGHATLVGSGAAAVWKIPRGYLWRSQIFDLRESEGYQPSLKSLCFKVGHEGLTQQLLKNTRSRIDASISVTGVILNPSLPLAV